MRQPADDAYAQKVLSLARADAERAVANPDKLALRSVAMFMADELTRLSGEPGLTAALAGDARKEASAIRERMKRSVRRRIGA
ncbi:MAG TPA: hypothetical protein VG797_04275 [Phycisphaerales bacterium]|nr:hypothetical protein [Phycisphaerales bacterium]